jgi:4-hydroxy-3-polyprenylbenzoate decarboxylase
MYRVQKVDKRTCMMHWQVHKDGRQHLLDSDGHVPVAVVIGTDPAITYSATAPLPPALDEMMFAGFLRGQKVEMVKAVSQDIEVPAHAEIVLEGYVDATDIRDEGPFGDHTGFYTPVDQYPTFHVTAITMRRDAIYSTTIVGMPPMEDYWLGKATERLFLPLITMTVPDLVDMNLPLEGVFHNCAIVSVKKRYPGHAKKLINAVGGLGLLSLTRCVIVVDHDINARDWKDVMWAISTKMDPARDITVIESTPIDYLDFASPESGLGSKIGLDATDKWPPETKREWGEEIRMDEAVVERVNDLWGRLGLPGDGTPIWK